jgi:hypothetical protein
VYNILPSFLITADLFLIQEKEWKFIKKIEIHAQIVSRYRESEAPKIDKKIITAETQMNVTSSIQTTSDSHLHFTTYFSYRLSFKKFTWHEDQNVKS